MNKLMTICFACFCLSFYAQEKKQTDQQQAKQAIVDFFEGFHKGDTTLIAKTIAHNIVMHTIVKTKEGKIKAVASDMKAFLKAIHERPENQKWEEKLLDFKIDANNAIAQIWTPYQFFVNDQFSHCGVNIFQLYNDGKSWKIFSIADTRKREGCN